MEWLGYFLAASFGAIVGYFVAFLCFISHDCSKREDEMMKDVRRVLEG